MSSPPSRVSVHTIPVPDIDGRCELIGLAVITASEVMICSCPVVKLCA
jgi:hypothetical protein